MAIGILANLFSACTPLAAQKSWICSSPNGQLHIEVQDGEMLAYRVIYRDMEVIQKSQIAMQFKHTIIGSNARILDSYRREVNQQLKPTIPHKNAVIADHFHEMVLELQGDYMLIVRAYDDAVAYRIATNFAQEEAIVESEIAEFRFNGDFQTLYPLEPSMFTHFEQYYKELRLSQIDQDKMAFLPVYLVRDGTRVLIMEADLYSYPGMFVMGSSSDKHALRGKFAPYPKKEGVLTRQFSDGRDYAVVEPADFIAKTTGKRSYPWRIIAVTDNDGHLVENETVFKLARPLALKDTSWIKPGLVAWDWWNANNIIGVPFEAGINTATYKAYIDFAYDYDIPYIILDEGWSRSTIDILEAARDIDVPELVRYGKTKNVSVILWMLWSALDNHLEEALDLYSKWGIRGIKVDFMQRDDQKMVDFYWRVAERAAEHKLIVDFHGAYKPSGLRRAYPNVITREGLRGLEHNKWSSDETPHQDLILPFIRMVPGPMDYTPGAMANAQAKDFAPIFDNPMSQGTRTHQMAMYAVYESPLQMLADSPSRYRKESECTVFISKMPAVWHETRVLAGKVGKYLVVARRHDSNWYIGAMADEPVSLNVKLDFLRRPYHAVIFRDGPNAERNAMDYVREEKVLAAGSTVTIRMSQGGGWVARLEAE